MRNVNWRVVCIDNLALGRYARQIGTYYSGATSAVDGDNSTASCTRATVGRKWWCVDLGHEYHVGHVTITSINVDADLGQQHWRLYHYVE